MAESLNPNDPRAKTYTILQQILAGTGAALDYEPIAQHFSANGDGTGSIDLAVDGSSTPVTLTVTAQTGQKLRIARIVLQMYTNAGAFEFNKFASLAALTNGMSFVLAKTSGNINLNGGQAIKRDYDLIDKGFDVWNPPDLITDTDWMQFVLDCRKVYGTLLKLDVDDAAELQLTVNDNLSSISLLQAFVTGYDENASY